MKNGLLTYFIIFAISLFLGALALANLVNNKFEKPEYKESVSFKAYIETLDGEEFTIVIKGKTYKVSVRKEDVEK